MFFAKKTIAVHPGRFHADDLFAAAMLFELHQGKAKLIRTSDEKELSRADYVADVGRVYDASKNRFDHHQGNVGARPNGVPYAASGLVWKHFGEQLAGSKDAADIVDHSLIMQIDVTDTGYAGPKPLIDDIYPYFLDDVAKAFDTTWIEKEQGVDTTPAFLELLPFACRILQREILKAQASLKAKDMVLAAYEAAEDKRIIVMDRFLPLGALDEKKEVLYVVSPSSRAGTWAVSAMRTNKHEYGNRKDLPKEWGGKHDEELAQITGVPDAMFCHLGLFLAVAKSKEGALALAKLAADR